MKIGVLSTAAYRIVTATLSGWQIHSFTISDSDLSFHQIFSSAYATPARYVQEIFDRLCLLESGGTREPVLVFNPFFRVDKPTILRALAALRRESRGDHALVLVDCSGRPIGYRLPASITPVTSHRLTLLSTVDGRLDVECLRAVFAIDARAVVLRNVKLDTAPGNGFATIENTPVYAWIAARAIAAIEAAADPSAVDFVAVMPHHAGDVLFLGLARVATPSHISTVAVHRVYRPILEDVAPDFGLIALDAPVANRSGNLQRGVMVQDHEYFEAIKGQLPHDRLYNYLRLSRDYSATTFHLLDHFAFSLGRKFFRRADLLSAQRPPGLRSRPSVGEERLRILLHLDAGWPLKVLPPAAQRELVERLLARGYAVTVLAPPGDAELPCPAVTFESLQQLIGLLQSHHVTVGMDSFPCHYSAHVLGLPTLCLFGSTRPANSDAPAAPDYVALSIGLDCVPCSGFNVCPRFGGPDCRNFVAPAAVVAAVDRLIAQAYGRALEPAARPTAPPRVYADSIVAADPGPRAQPSETLWMDFPHAQAVIAAVRGRVAAVAATPGRLASRIRKEGLAKTTRRIMDRVARSTKERIAASRQ